MPNFGTNTCCLLTDLKIRKIEGGKMLPPITTRAFGPRCVKAESLGPEGSMIGYDKKKKRTKKQKSTWNPIFSKIVRNSLNNGLWAVLTPVLDFPYFWTFCGKYQIFWSYLWFFCSTKNTLVNPSNVVPVLWCKYLESFFWVKIN